MMASSGTGRNKKKLARALAPDYSEWLKSIGVLNHLVEEQTMNRTCLLSVAMFCLICLVGRLQAAPILVPGGLNPGDPYHLVFVSSARNDANFGGISGADAFVQGLADSAGVGNTAGISWQSILSDSSINAISRFNPTAPIYDMQGNRVAVNGAALWNAAIAPLENPIAFDETGSGGIFPEVWTGTDNAGVFVQADSNWLAAPFSGSARSGLALQTNGQWVHAIGTSEAVPQSIFATSGLLFAPSNEVPEPASVAIWALLGIALMGYAGWRKRGRSR